MWNLIRNELFDLQHELTAMRINRNILYVTNVLSPWDLIRTFTCTTNKKKKLKQWIKCIKLVLPKTSLLLILRVFQISTLHNSLLIILFTYIYNYGVLVLFSLLLYWLLSGPLRNTLKSFWNSTLFNENGLLKERQKYYVTIERSKYSKVLFSFDFNQPKPSNKNQLLVKQLMKKFYT